MFQIKLYHVILAGSSSIPHQFQLLPCFINFCFFGAITFDYFLLLVDVSLYHLTSKIGSSQFILFDATIYKITFNTLTMASLVPNETSSDTISKHTKFIMENDTYTNTAHPTGNYRILFPCFITLLTQINSFSRHSTASPISLLVRYCRHSIRPPAQVVYSQHPVFSRQ